MYLREDTRKVKVGNLEIGGDAPVTIQSMTNTKTEDAEATLKQIERLAQAGCEIVRVAVPTMEAAQAVKAIKEKSPIPVVADIHFDYRLALECIKNGADKIRLNPGNIGGKDRVAAVAAAAKERGIPIRIGVNSGSVEKDLLEQYGGPTPDAVVESAFRHIRMLEENHFEDIVVSLKLSNVVKTIEACRKFAERSDIPLHLGVTEAGTLFSGSVKSAVGIGSLLSLGIGNTIRVSLTGDPAEEVKTASLILRSLELREPGVTVISCPTCGRTKVDLEPIAREVENRLTGLRKNLSVAVMGCAVNGPGEAREADFGVACGNGEGLLFQKGEIVKKVPEEQIVDQLIRLILSE